MITWQDVVNYRNVCVFYGPCKPCPPDGPDKPTLYECLSCMIDNDEEGQSMCS